MNTTIVHIPFVRNASLPIDIIPYLLNVSFQTACTFPGELICGMNEDFGFHVKYSIKYCCIVCNSSSVVLVISWYLLI